MKRKSILILTVCMLLVGKICLYAQTLPVIVKDYNNCTVGLQDENGKWIAQPVYTQIWPFMKGRAVMIRDGYYGLLDINGKEIIPAEWSSVSQTSTKHGSGASPVFGSYDHLYTCRKNFRTAVINRDGKVVIDVPYALSTFTDSTAAAQDSLGHWHFVSLNGHIVHLLPSVKSEPAFLFNDLYSFRYDSTLIVPKKKPLKKSFAGVMRNDGSIVIPPVFNRIEIYPPPYPVIRADSGQHTTYYNTTCRRVIGPIKNTQAVGTVNPFGYQGKAVIERNAKYGITNWAGDTILDVIYEAAPYEILTDAYLVRMNGKYGVVSDSGVADVPIAYEHIERANNYYTGALTSCFITRSDSGWNIINASGQRMLVQDQDSLWSANYYIALWDEGELSFLVYSSSEGRVGLTQHTYDTWFPEGQKGAQSYYFGDGDYHYSYGDSVVSENYEWEAGLDQYSRSGSLGGKKKKKHAPRPANPYPYYLHQRPVNFMQYRRPDTLRSEHQEYTVHKIIYAQDEHQHHGHIAAVTRRDSIGNQQLYRADYIENGYYEFSNSNEKGLMHSDGRIIILPGLYESFSFAGSSYELIEARDDNGEFYLLDTSGKIIHTSRSITQMSFHEAGSIWIAQSNTSYPGISDCSIAWGLYDYRSGKYILDTSLRILHPFAPNSGTQVLSTQYGAGVINTKTKRILVEPKYSRIIRIDGASRYFAVYTCNGKVGVVDSAGTLIGDTLYSGFTKIHGMSPYNNAERDRPLTADDAYLFYTYNDTFALFTGNGKFQIIDSADYHRILLLLADEDYRKEQRLNNQCYSCRTTLTWTNSSLKPWQDSLLFYSFFYRCNPNAERYGMIRYNDCACSEIFYPAYDYSEYNYHALLPIRVYFTTDSLISYVNQSGESSNEWSTRSFICNNVILTNDGLHAITLDSLFAGEAWKNIVIDSVLSYLQHHPGIDANCSKPDLYPKLLAKRFLILRDALYLYPEWSRKTNGQTLPARPVIVIPWRVLDPHLRPGMKTKVRR